MPIPAKEKLRKFIDYTAHHGQIDLNKILGTVKGLCYRGMYLFSWLYNDYHKNIPIRPQYIPWQLQSGARKDFLGR